MEIQGSWCYTRESGAASIFSGEPSVPRKIPGGVARGSIPGASGFDPGRGAVCWKISGGMTSRPTPMGQQSGVVSLISFVYTRSGRRFCL